MTNVIPTSEPGRSPNPESFITRGRRPLICPACGSEWFRLEWLHRYTLHMFFYNNHTQSWPSGLVEHTPMKAEIAICLCGTPVIPRVNGVPVSRTHAAELAAFYASAEGARLYTDLDQAIQRICERKATRESVTEVRTQASEVRAQLDTLSKKLRIRREARAVLPPSKREAATHGKDKIVADLQQRLGLKFDDSRRCVDAVIEIWKDALRWGDSVETPVGVIRAKRNPARWHAKQERRIRLESGFVFDEGGRPTMYNDVTAEQSAWTCPDCGGAFFISADVHKFELRPYSSAIGGELIRKRNPVAILQCMCGRVLAIPGRGERRHPDYRDFFDSLDKAEAVRSGQMRSLAKRSDERYAPKEEVADLRKMLADQETALRLTREAAEKPKRRKRRTADLDELAIVWRPLDDSHFLQDLYGNAPLDDPGSEQESR